MKNYFLSAIVIVLGLAAFGFGIYALSQSIKLNQVGIITEGEVIRTYHSKKPRKSEIEFTTPDGQKHHFTRSYRGTKGEKLMLIYDPQDLKNVKINTFWQRWGGGMIALVLGGIFAGMGIWLLLKDIKRVKEINSLRQFGKHVQVTLKEVKRRKLSKSKVFYVIAEYKDGFGKVQELKSDELKKDPTPFLQNKILYAYIDYNRPEIYWIDTFDLK